MLSAVFALVPAIVGFGKCSRKFPSLQGELTKQFSHDDRFNNTGIKGALLFGTRFVQQTGVQIAERFVYLGIWISGTFGSALLTVYAYNASNTSGHTKKVSLPPLINC